MYRIIPWCTRSRTYSYEHTSTCSCSALSLCLFLLLFLFSFSFSRFALRFPFPSPPSLSLSCVRSRQLKSTPSSCCFPGTSTIHTNMSIQGRIWHKPRLYAIVSRSYTERVNVSKSVSLTTEPDPNNRVNVTFTPTSPHPTRSHVHPTSPVRVHGGGYKRHNNITPHKSALSLSPPKTRLVRDRPN